MSVFSHFRCRSMAMRLLGDRSPLTFHETIFIGSNRDRAGLV